MDRAEYVDRIRRELAEAKADKSTAGAMRVAHLKTELSRFENAPTTPRLEKA